MRLSVPTRRQARPSLIPLIDVMLVLLFFFMLASTYVGYHRTQLELAPGGRGGGVDEPDVVRAVLLDDGRLRIGAELLASEAAITRLGAAREVRLSPAPGVPLQSLLAAWEKLAAAGVRVQLAEGVP